jgi:hypothetical protein
MKQMPARRRALSASGPGGLQQNVKLFLSELFCTGNSCRSQMAEGFLRTYAGNHFDVYRAGLEPKDEIHPNRRDRS